MSENFIPSQQSAEERLVREVQEDFAARQKERRKVEAGWELNMNFVCGNQYCGINYADEVVDEEKGYYWQTRRVFNHIAPTLDIRYAKLARIRPSLAVRAASDEEADSAAAELASAILSAAGESSGLESAISTATVWSETCGTSFYKVLWDSEGGSAIAVTPEGEKLREGEVRVVPLSPFEIYPYTLAEEDIAAQPSIIYARAVPVQDIYSAYGVKLSGRDIEEFALSPYSASSHTSQGSVRAVRHGYEVVIERYTRPTADLPEGRLTVVAGGKLLYDGDLPYINGDGGTRGYPFIKQVCMPLAGSFFGASVVDRMIPVQRAYNAVRNRKHEFLNRISMGTVAVEEGSVDTDELIEDGLRPGKVLIYRQGGKPPEMLTLGTLPEAFEREEETLQNEFSKISGTNGITQNGDSFSSVTSATGLQLLIEQDDARLNVSYDSIKQAIKLIGKHILRLYRQFAAQTRLLRCAGDGGLLKVYYFKGGDISSDDVVLESDSDVNLTPAERRNVAYELIDKGLLSDDEGRLTRSAKNKILRYIGYDSFAAGRDLIKLHASRAAEENSAMESMDMPVHDYDDHSVHIAEHTAYLLSGVTDAATESRISAHIKNHKNKLLEEKQNG